MPLIGSYQHLSFLRLTFLLVVLFLAVNTVSLPFGAAATSVSDKERYRRAEEEKLSFLEGKWKVLTGLQRRGLSSGWGRNAGVKKQSSEFNTLMALTHTTSSLLLSIPHQHQHRGLSLQVQCINLHFSTVESFARSEPFQEVSTSHPTGHSASRGTVAVVVGLATLAVAGFMI